MTERLDTIRDQNRFQEIRQFLGIVSHWMALPLYFVFWICDIIYAPELKWEFLGLRAMIIPVCILTPWAANRIKTHFHAQVLAVLFSFFVAIFISFMTYRTEGGASPYYAGLNLVAIGTLSFLPLSHGFYALAAMSIYGPFYVFSLLRSTDSSNLKLMAINSFFIIGTISISLVIRYFSEQLRKKELLAQEALRKEIIERDFIIATKSEEAVKLATLSNQFSPQVVDAIREGKVDMVAGVHRSQICAIFIDIVNSTERVLRLDKDNVHKVITMFMEDTIKTLLKYDITIDKFLGDGILAFANDPVKYDDYCDRILMAAVEVRSRIALRQEQYENYWMNHLNIRVGIASGFANVGFYGNDKAYKSYTAIGPVVNLASRICSSAEANQIVISQDVKDRLKHSHYGFDFLGKKTFKGFEQDLIKVYSVGDIGLDQTVTEDLDCPACQDGVLFLDTSPETGIYVLKCRNCGHIKGETVAGPLSRVA